MQVEGQHKGSNTLVATGARVSNAYVTWLIQWNNPEKSGLIPHNDIGWHRLMFKGAIRYKMDMRIIR